MTDKPTDDLWECIECKTKYHPTHFFRWCSDYCQRQTLMRRATLSKPTDEIAALAKEAWLGACAQLVGEMPKDPTLNKNYYIAIEMFKSGYLAASTHPFSARLVPELQEKIAALEAENAKLTGYLNQDQTIRIEALERQISNASKSIAYALDLMVKKWRGEGTHFGREHLIFVVDVLSKAERYLGRTKR